MCVWACNPLYLSICILATGSYSQGAFLQSSGIHPGYKEVSVSVEVSVKRQVLQPNLLILAGSWLPVMYLYISDHMYVTK